MAVTSGEQEVGLLFKVFHRLFRGAVTGGYQAVPA
jgi:hypothetical protein